MYSTGTEFYKLIGEAKRRKDSVNTSADIAQNAKDLVESWTPIKVVKLELIHGVDMTIVGRLTETEK